MEDSPQTPPRRPLEAPHREAGRLPLQEHSEAEQEDVVAVAAACN
jgi:hypothetical protein